MNHGNFSAIVASGTDPIQYQARIHFQNQILYIQTIPEGIGRRCGADSHWCPVQPPNREREAGAAGKRPCHPG
jgi:hypothetical protein